jgi:hypothetical protein
MTIALGTNGTIAFDDRRKDPEMKSALRLLEPGLYWMLNRFDAQNQCCVVGIGSNKLKRECATKLALALAKACGLDAPISDCPPAFNELVQAVLEQRMTPCEAPLHFDNVAKQQCYLVRRLLTEEPAIDGLGKPAVEMKCEVQNKDATLHRMPEIAEAKEAVSQQARSKDDAMHRARRFFDVMEVSMWDVRYI